MSAILSSSCISSSTPTMIVGALLALAVLGWFCGTRAWKYWCRINSESSRLTFHDVPPLYEFDISKTLPFKYRPWRAGKFQMTMGIRRMPEEDWLVIDSLYTKEQKLRADLLETNYKGVVQCLPAATEACKEALECIVNFLIRRYPGQFWLLEDKPSYVHNAITSKTFKFMEPYDDHPLAVAAQLAMEDINLLMQGTGENSKEHFLLASFSMAPAGWYIQQRIGWPLWKIHGPVPLWDLKLKNAMEKYFPPLRFLQYNIAERIRFFRGLKVSTPVQRNNFFIQTNDTMFQPEPFADSTDSPPQIEDLRIRHERQTLRRLPRTRAVMFLVRTYLSPITELESELENLYSLRSAINAWPAEVAKYKGRHVWHAAFENWCDEVLGDYVPESEEVSLKDPE